MEGLRTFFWALSLCVIAAYAFFWVLGAFGIDDAVPLSIVVAILVVLWVIHALLQRRNPDVQHDPRLLQGRERRGF